MPRAVASRSASPRIAAAALPAPTFSIGELAREFGLTTRAIRFYEDCGLLRPGRAGKNRVYTARDRARLTLTLRGKRLARVRDRAGHARRVRSPLPPVPPGERGGQGALRGGRLARPAARAGAAH